MSGFLHVWNAGDEVKHADLNGNFALHDGEIATNTTAIAANTTAIAANTASIASNAASSGTALASAIATTAKNPATADLAMASYKVTGLAQGVSDTDGARLDQVGWRRIGTADSIATGMTAVGFSLPSGFSKYRIEWTNLLTSSGSGSFIALASQDGGASYIETSTYFTMLSGFLSSGGSVSSSQTTGYWILGLATSGTQRHEGFLELGAGGNVHPSMDWMSDSAGYALSIMLLGGYPTTSLNNVLIQHTGGAFAGGAVRLLGWAP